MKEAGVDEIMLDGIFIDRNEYALAQKLFKDVLCGADAKEAYDVLKSKNEAYGEGYMYTKTNLVKVEGERG